MAQSSQGTERSRPEGAATLRRFPPRRGAVAAPQPIAAEVGAEILREGGNAVDAAIATAFAQGVVDPFMGGIGGFGCAVGRTGGASYAIGFHGKAGSLAREDIFAEDVLGQVSGHAERYAVRHNANQIGYQSVVTPGVPAGFEALHREHGRVPWEKLLEPAIGLASDGIPLPGEVYASWTALTQPGYVDGWTRVNATHECRKIFTRNGELLRPGDLLRQPGYASTLMRLASRGARDFYQGDIAEAIAADFAKNEGLITRTDLESYSADLMDVVSGKYRGFDIHSAPLPASGIQLIQMLQALERLAVGRLFKEHEAQYVHLVGRAMLAAFRDRAEHMGDPAFIDVPIDWLASQGHASDVADLIMGDGTLLVPRLSYPEPRNTTHVSVVDEDGNAVALTHTLGSGSGVVVESLGFVLNNCMYQFNPLPGTPNSIEPGKSRLTGISPTLVISNNLVRLAIGGAGGTRIPTAVLHVIMHLLDHGMTPTEAVNYPRFHTEGPYLELEARLSARIGHQLSAKGWQIASSPFAYDTAYATAYVVSVDEQGAFAIGSDPRRGGGEGWA